MTCEVIVMNKRGVALAADSAVTLGEGEKIYYTAEKLFQLSGSVGIMTYGSADIMGVPWETVVKIYSGKLGDRCFDHIEQYAEDFLRFIETSEALFSETTQRQRFRSLVGSYWQDQFLRPLQKHLDGQKKKSVRDTNTFLMALLIKDKEIWKTYPPLAEWSISYADRVLTAYTAIIDEVEKDLFGRFRLSPEVRQGLHDVIKSMYGLKWFHPMDRSGVVIAGMGEAEAFPALASYTVGTMAAGKLRYVNRGNTRVTNDESAMVVPFAQDDTIDMFYDGIYPELKETLVKIVGKLVNKHTGRSRIKGSKKSADLEKEIRAALAEQMTDKYKQPLMQAVDALPRYDLARMAETLVSLTALQARMSANCKETVGGPIDVALISKGEGFTWVKRKNIFGGAAQVNAFCMPVS